ncbi:MAG: hypothetical protein PHQ43_00995 [Dehalococcoidales bacterium]|nr:hypothetical protein [Dehalococcoidales bacterium]
MMRKPLYTTGDIASVTMKNEETVRVWCRTGKLRAKKIGGERGSYMVTDAALREFLSDEYYHAVIDQLGPLPADQPETGGRP